jgi:hypothetical protein
LTKQNWCKDGDAAIAGKIAHLKAFDLKGSNVPETRVTFQNIFDNVEAARGLSLCARERCLMLCGFQFCESDLTRL